MGRNPSPDWPAAESHDYDHLSGAFHAAHQERAKHWQRSRRVRRLLGGTATTLLLVGGLSALGEGAGDHNIGDAFQIGLATLVLAAPTRLMRNNRLGAEHGARNAMNIAMAQLHIAESVKADRPRWALVQTGGQLIDDINIETVEGRRRNQPPQLQISSGYPYNWVTSVKLPQLGTQQ